MMGFPIVGFGANNGGGIKWDVVFTGKLPPPQVLNVEAAAEVCGKSVAMQDVQLNPKSMGVQYVFVSLENLLLKVSDVAQPKNLIFNKNCAFSPPIAAARKRDVIDVHNQEQHAYSSWKDNLLNVAQLPGSRPIPKVIKRKGLYHIKCDKHTFMKETLMGFDHAYFTVTAEQGTFQFPTLSPGHNIVTVWHQTLGMKQQDLLVPVGDMSQAIFIFL